MSWFANVDVDDVPDNPNELPNNTYKFQVISAVLKETTQKYDSAGQAIPTKTGITFKYQILDGSWNNFFPLVDWVRVPDANTRKDEMDRMLSYIKMRLLAFGFSTDEIQQFGPEMVDKCIKRSFYGTTSMKKDNQGNTNIRVVKFDPIGDGANTIVDFPDDDM